MNFQEYYNKYAKDVLKRNGYPLRAKYKAKILFEFSSERLGKNISSIADVGGCYGYCLAKFQNLYEYSVRPMGSTTPESAHFCKCHSIVYELGEDFINIGPTLFPNIRFFHSSKIGQKEFDLVLLCDVLEHIEDYDEFLSKVNTISKKFVLIWSPIEMSLIRKLAIFLKLEPRMKSGIDHKEGHINFWGVKDTMKLVEKHFKILKIGYQSHRSMTENDGLEHQERVEPAPIAIFKKVIKYLGKCLPENLYVRLVGGHLMILGEVLENRNLREVP